MDVPHLVHVGLYGLEDDAPELVTAIVPRVETAAAIVPEAWVEDKRVSIAVHYRQAPDPLAARSALLAALQPVATGSGLRLVEGKMVLELRAVRPPAEGERGRASRPRTRAAGRALRGGRRRGRRGVRGARRARRPRASTPCVWPSGATETPEALVAGGRRRGRGPRGTRRAAAVPLTRVQRRRRRARSRSSSCPPTHRDGGLASTSRESPRARRVSSSAGISSARGERLGHLVHVEGVDAQRVPPEPAVGPGVPRQDEDAVAPVEQRALHRDEVHAVDHRVHEQDVVEAVGGEGTFVVVLQSKLDRRPAGACRARR